MNNPRGKQGEFVSKEFTAEYRLVIAQRLERIKSFLEFQQELIEHLQKAVILESYPLPKYVDDELKRYRGLEDKINKDFEAIDKGEGMKIGEVHEKYKK